MEACVPLRGLSRCSLALVGVLACACATEPSNTGDGGAGYRDVDSGLKPLIVISTVEPFRTNVAAATAPTFSFAVEAHAALPAGQLEKTLRSSVLLKTAGGALIPTTWKDIRSDMHSVEAQVEATLPKDTECVLEAKSIPGFEYISPKTYFNSGSLPRVNKIELVADAQGHSWLTVRVSEKVDAKKLASSVSILSEKGAPIPTKVTYSSERSVTLSRTDRPFQHSDVIRIRVEEDVGASSGVKLNGTYQGKGKSAAFEKQFRISDFFSYEHQTWRPQPAW